VITVGELRAVYAAGRRTPRDVAEAFLAAAAAADRLDPPLRAFVSIDPADVRRQADESTRRLARGEARSPLEGVPVAVKDGYDVGGHPTRAGTRVLGREPAASDAPSVARLREAGALLVGKTNMHELAVHPSGLNVHHGVARNPHDPTRDTGGSSSGSGAAVASGLVPIALGTDSGGSVRIPASLCGIASLKGTFGRVPTSGIVPLTWSLDHAGPLAASVEDVRLAFGVLAGAPLEVRPLPTRLRVGVCDPWWSGADPAVAAVCRSALDRLGAELVSIDLPHVGLAVAAGSCILLVEGAAAHARLLDGDALQPSVHASLEIGRGFTGVDFVKAQQVRTHLARDLAAAFGRCDVLATPTTAIAAPRYRPDAFQTGETDEARINALIHFTFAANLTGHPAASVPCGRVESLPIGLQLLAPHGQDALALAVAAAVERTTTLPTPRISFDLLG
jgi:Asp-tRNA(Asn)/Glu-tRNA(Gln) amidotransferase A subunit family amidase